MRKSLVLLVFLASLTACADRERLNCPRTKNKALRGAVIEPVITPTTTTATRYGTGGKCV
jgi:hypothetical protein